jgi:phospholipid/cholesterol/gamma-HCH transport system substrate-binding protein
VLVTVTENARSLVELARNATEGVNRILMQVEQGDGTMARLLNDPALYERFVTITDTLNAMTSDARVMIENLEQVSHWGTLGAFRFAELMEAGKHNWLFRRYFEERGYLERADFEIRERALQESHDRIAERELELLRWQERLEALRLELEGAGRDVGVEVNDNDPPGQ